MVENSGYITAVFSAVPFGTSGDYLEAFETDDQRRICRKVSDDSSEKVLYLKQSCFKMQTIKNQIKVIKLIKLN